jgi:hypothetical protein
MASACRSRLSISDGDTVSPSTGAASGIPNAANAKSAARTPSSAGGQPVSAAVPGSESKAARSAASAASASVSALPATVRSLAAASMRSVRSLKLSSFGSPLAEPVGSASALAGRSAARRQSAASDARPCVISRRNRASTGCKRDKLTLPALAAVKSNSVVVAGSSGALAGAMTVARSSGTAFAHRKWRISVRASSLDWSPSVSPLIRTTSTGSRPRPANDCNAGAALPFRTVHCTAAGAGRCWLSQWLSCRLARARGESAADQPSVALTLSASSARNVNTRPLRGVRMISGRGSRTHVLEPAEGAEVEPLRRAAAAQRSEPLSVESGDPGIDPVRAEIDVLGHQSLEPRRRQIGKRRDRRLGVGGVLDWRGFDRSVRSGRGEHPVGKRRRAAGKAAGATRWCRA